MAQTNWVEIMERENFEKFVIDSLKENRCDNKDIKGEVTNICTRLSVLETKYSTHVKEKVRTETRLFKVLSILATIGSGFIGLWTFIKP